MTPFGGRPGMWRPFRVSKSSKDVGEPPAVAATDVPDDSDQGGREPGPANRTPPWVPALAVVAAFLAALAAGLLQPGGTISGEITGHYALAEPRPPVAEGHPFLGQVTATQDGLASVSVFFATYVGSIRCTLDVSLTDPRSGAQIGSRTLDCDNLADNAPSEILSFPAVADSAGRTFDLRIALVPGSIAGPSVWTNPDHQDALLATYDPQPTMAGHAREVLDRIAVYAPGWAS